MYNANEMKWQVVKPGSLCKTRHASYSQNVPRRLCSFPLLRHCKTARTMIAGNLIGGGFVGGSAHLTLIMTRNIVMGNGQWAMEELAGVVVGRGVSLRVQ